MSASTPVPAQRASTRPLLLLLSGNGGVALLTLARNIFAARLIGLEDFGIAVSFAILLSVVEMVTTLGAQQMIVQDANGHQEDVQASLHFVQLSRGILGALLIYACAEHAARFMGTPEVTWAYKTLALVPLLSGLIHMDAWRYQRAQRFAPLVCIQVAPALLALLLVWPLYIKFGDFRVLLIATVVQAAGGLVMSWLVAERRYFVGLNREHLNGIVRFGWPLALNGVLLLGVFHGEKLIVGYLQGPAPLALLAMGFTLTLTPALILGRSLQSYALPILVSKRGDPYALDAAATTIIRLCLLAGLALAATLLVVAPVIPLALGDDFAPVLNLMPMLAVLHGLRIARAGVSAVALAIGTTTNAALGNVPRILALPIIYYLLKDGGMLPSVLWVAAAAEAAGLCLSYVVLRLRLPTR